MSAQILISVILPVYNAEKYLQEAIASILQQSYRHFELLVLNDGSTDGSEAIVKTFSDPRIVYVYHQNMGLAATLNKGIQLAQGEYIARHDNDDVSDAERLGKQLAFLQANPDVVLLGTAAEIIDENGKSTGRFHHHPNSNADLKWALLFNNPFVHSSVMFKKTAAVACGAYSTDKNYFEDYHLWSCLAAQGQLANLSDCLLKYREVQTGMSKSTEDYVQRVKNQSILNIAMYLDRLDKFKIDAFVEMQHGNLKGMKMHEAKPLHAELLTTLFEMFCVRQKVSPSLLMHAKTAVQVSFKRQCYNVVLANHHETWYTRLGAKIQRKLLFTFYKKYL
jgi:glycosyltransferase involved in cell wall biosynthesis